MLSSSDNEILESIKQADQEAFTLMYRKYWHPLFGIAYRRLKDKQVAEELVQDLFVNLWKKRESLQIANLEHYLFKSIKFAIINHIHSQVVQDKYAEYYQHFVSLEDSQTEDMIAYQDLSVAIERNLDKLPEKTRHVFQLNRLQSWPIAKIADHLHLSEKAVEYHLTKSLKSLKVSLKEFILSLSLLIFWP